MLDASKAFDRVEYIKLFNLLLSKGICPVIARFLVTLYINHIVCVKLCNHLSITFGVSNGVKQGAVIHRVHCYVDSVCQGVVVILSIHFVMH